MKCPACSNSLHTREATTFLVDICCDGCGGIWLDQGELVKCDEVNEPFPAELLRVIKNSNVVIDRNKQRKCPKCSDSQLGRIVVDPEIRFEIDQCSVCNGCWLDIGELEFIRNRNKESSDLDQRLRNYDQQITGALKDPIRAKRVRAVLELIFKS